MNKIFKSKWNAATQTQVACSELAKGKSKTGGKMAVVGVAVGAVCAVLPVHAHAAACTSETDGTYLITTQCDIPDSTLIVSSNYPNFALLRRSVEVNIGNIKFTATNGKAVGVVANQYGDGLLGGKINVGNITARVEGSEGSDPIVTHSAVSLTAKDVDIVSTTAGYTGGNSSGGVAAYGVLAGSFNDSGEQDSKFNGVFSTVTMNNLTLEQSTSGGKVLPILNTGLRAIQAGSYGRGNGTSGKIVINEQLNMHLKGERIEGIYASGSATHATTGNKAVSTVMLNNSNIIAESTGTRRSTESAVIKIGKVRAIGTGEGEVHSNGALNIDASKLRDGTGIKLYSSNSLFQADGANSSTHILAQGNAIQVSPRDWQEPAAMAADSIRVLMRNANLNTNSNTASLIKVWENQTNTQINISGNDSIATAAPDGWLLEVGARDGSRGSTVAGSTTANFTGGKYFGLSTLSDSQRANPSTLDINLDGANTTWYLMEKGHTQTATLTTLNIGNGATLDATGAFKPADKTVNLFDGHSMTVKDAANITASPLTANQDFIVKGDVNNNQGNINLAENRTTAELDYVNTLTIDGNYTADQGYLKLNTEWRTAGDEHGANAKSDSLIIKGDASGTTIVQAVGKNGTPNVIDGSIDQLRDARTVPVIRVEGTDKGSDTGNLTLASDNYTYRSTFTGTANTTGAGQVQLASRLNASGHREYYWTVKAHSGSDILNPAVPAYVLAGQTNLAMGYSTLATLHERRDENQVLSWDKLSERHDSQTWGRIFSHNIDLSGKTRLDAEHRIRGFQVGHDFAIDRTDEGGHRLTGIYAAYAHADSRYSDRLRSISGVVVSDKYTGSGREQGVYLGATHTRYAANGAYLDLVGQIGWVSNRYIARDGTTARQQGVGIALSAEAGRPYQLNDKTLREGVWYIEPQAQLVYQALHLNGFNDGSRSISGRLHHGLRARVGVRLDYNRQRDNHRSHSFYGIANILHDLTYGQSVRVGRDELRENQARTWYELGVGGQLPVGQQSHLFADVRYESGFGGRGVREGYRGTIGYKYTW